MNAFQNSADPQFQISKLSNNQMDSIQASLG